jgi:hypothetical protein
MLKADLLLSHGEKSGLVKKEGTKQSSMVEPKCFDCNHGFCPERRVLLQH